MDLLLFYRFLDRKINLEKLKYFGYFYGIDGGVFLASIIRVTIKQTTMKINLRTVILPILFFSLTYAFGQTIDTLTFFSKSFQEERTVYVKTPEFYKYQSESVKLPVIYILDGQHDWFVNPLQSTIRYLQYTHEIPQALIVTIPHNNRINECGIVSLQGDILPLHKFITEELNEHIEQYNLSEYRMIIGHSFSASFALYSYLKNPKFYSAVFAHTPLDHFEKLIVEMQSNQLNKNKIYISIGGIANDKDYYHRNEFEKLKIKYPSFFEETNIYEANSSAHNAVPIVTSPHFLTKEFEKFSSRYSHIAQVDDEYKLLENPQSISKELEKIDVSSRAGVYFYQPEIADLNGLASRYLNSGFVDYGIEIYEIGTKYYPGFFGFHLSLYELLLETNVEKAKWHFKQAEELLRTLEKDLAEGKEILQTLESEKTKNGW